MTTARLATDLVWSGEEPLQHVITWALEILVVWLAVCVCVCVCLKGGLMRSCASSHVA
jgi:hypothetical protein